jgi:ion channel
VAPRSRRAGAIANLSEIVVDHPFRVGLGVLSLLVIFVATGALWPDSAGDNHWIAYLLLGVATVFVVAAFLGLAAVWFRGSGHRARDIIVLLVAFVALFVVAGGIADWTLSHLLVGRYNAPFATHFFYPDGCQAPHKLHTRERDFACESLDASPLPVLRAFYLALATLTPAGAGDITAAHDSGRAILLVQAILGFGILAIGLALILPLIGASSQADQIEKLGQLKDRGRLTDDEFSVAKSKLL